MKGLKKSIIILLIIMFSLYNTFNITYGANDTYYTYKITNKITGIYNDRTQTCSYFVYSADGIITSVSGAENVTKISGWYICSCGKSYLSTTVWRPHYDATKHNYTPCLESKTKEVGYTFDLGNNETATIVSTIDSLQICRIYDSSSKVDNQIATYSINGGSSSTIEVCDTQSTDGMSRFFASGGDTIVVTNSDNVSVPTGISTSTLVIALLLLLSIILFIITKLIKRIKVTIS
jgi:hypothetical protein